MDIRGPFLWDAAYTKVPRVDPAGGIGFEEKEEAMSEGEDRPQTPESGDESASETPGQTGQAADPTKGSPTISGEDQEVGQTQSPAAEDDVGVPENPGEQK